MKLWEYRAIDAQLNTITGVLPSVTFLHLAVELRQKGLQVLDAKEVHQDHVLATRRLAAMKRRVNPAMTNRSRQPSNTSSVWQKINRLMRW